MERKDTVTGLRVVTFNVLPLAYGLVSRWAEQGGHTIVLAVTTPGPSTRRTPSYTGVVAMVPPAVDVLVTTRLRRVAAPLIRALQPDLIVSFTFPYRIPPEVRSLARHGAVNLHPTALPAYRGPNVMRPIYEGYPLLGATLHWTADEYDDGRILSQHTAPMPAIVTRESIFTAWGPLMAQAFAEGVTRAVAGEPGTAQDHAEATYAAQFSEAEHWLNWEEPGLVVQRKAAALNMFGEATATAQIGGVAHRVRSVEALTDAPLSAAPGAVLDRTDDTMVIATGDGAVRVSADVIA